MGFILNKKEQELPVTQKQRGQETCFPSPSANYHKTAHTMVSLVQTRVVFPLPSLIKKKSHSHVPFWITLTLNIFWGQLQGLPFALRPAVLLLLEHSLSMTAAASLASPTLEKGKIIIDLFLTHPKLGWSRGAIGSCWPLLFLSAEAGW